MAGGRELGFLKTNVCSLREQAARRILHNVRLQGHEYVELREEGKKSIFFCTLCLAPCYSDSVLFDHLKGNLHTERLSAAKVTLLGLNPWPFNDGVLFFDNSRDNDDEMVIADKNRARFPESPDNANGLAIVRYGDNLDGSKNGRAGFDGDGPDKGLCSDEAAANGENSDMVIPGVMIKDVISDLEVRFVGYGQIAARFREKNETGNDISRIWCEWLGKQKQRDIDTFKAPKHDFAIVTFSYDYGLGRQGLIDDVKSLLTYSPKKENGGSFGRKRKKSFSDPEDFSQSLSNQYELLGKDSSASVGSSSKLFSNRYDDQLVHTSLVLTKSIRRELRRQQRLAAERMCDICQQKMLPGKDVASLLNTKTGKLACSRRNVNGAFHVFHISCLIHWILLCEFQIRTSQSTNAKVRRKSGRIKNGSKCKQIGKDAGMKTDRVPIDFVLCPECQGTGEDIEGDDLEKPTVPLSEMFRYKIKASDAHRAWMRSPEVLQNCSTGFHFPSNSQEAVQENVSALKLLQFYGAY